MESVMRALTLSAVLAILSGAPVIAQEGGRIRGFRDRQGGEINRPAPGHPAGRPEGFRNLFEGLEISDEQKQKLIQVRRSSDMRRLRDRLVDERGKLRDMIKNLTSSESEVLSQLEKVTNTQSELNRSRVKNVLAMRTILTPEQFEKLSRKIEEHRTEQGFGPRGFVPRGETGRQGLNPGPQFQGGVMPGGEEPDGGMTDPFDIQ